MSAFFHRAIGVLGSGLTIAGGVAHAFPSPVMNGVVTIGGLVLALATNLDRVLNGNPPPTSGG